MACRRTTLPALVALGVIGIGARLPAQKPLPTLTITAAGRIDSAAGLRGEVSWATVSPRGVVAVGNMAARTLQFFSPEGKRLGTFDGAAKGMSSMAAMHLWVGDSLIVDDLTSGSYYLVFPHGANYRKSPHIGWNGGGTQPAMPPSSTSTGVQLTIVDGTINPEAFYPDGSVLTLVVLDSAQVPVEAWAGRPSGAFPLVQVSSNGVFVRVVAWVPHDDCARTYHFGAVTGGFASALCAGTLRNTRNGDRPFAFLETNAVDQNSGTYRITALRLGGDTLFSRKYPFSPIPLSAKDSASDVDGTIRYLTRKYPDQADAAAKAIRQLPPYTSYPPFGRVFVGRDSTIWIESSIRRPTPPTEHQWTVLASNGEPLGIVTVPGNVVVQDADRANVWAVELAVNAPTGLDPVTHMPYRSKPAVVVRYRVVTGSGVP